MQYIFYFSRKFFKTPLSTLFAFTRAIEYDVNVYKSLIIETS